MNIGFPDDSNFNVIADNMTRLLIGHISNGISNLNDVLQEGFGTGYNLSQADYNIAYSEITKIFKDALLKANRVMEDYDTSRHYDDEFEV